MNSGLRYLLDTDTCIYLLNGNPDIKNQIAQVGVETIAVSFMTKGELYFGAYNSSRVETNLERIRTFFEPPAPIVLPMDDAVMNCFGKFKAELRRKGRTIGDIDLLIAGVAIAGSLTLVTNNTKHFNRIPGLFQENWFVPSK